MPHNRQNMNKDVQTFAEQALNYGEDSLEGKRNEGIAHDDTCC